MASADTSQLYYCHECHNETNPDVEEFTCNLCGSGFVEAIDRSQMNTQPASGGLAADMLGQLLNFPLFHELRPDSFDSQAEESDEADAPVSFNTRSRRQNGNGEPVTSRNIRSVDIGRPFGLGRSSRLLNTGGLHEGAQFLFANSVGNFVLDHGIFNAIVTSITNNLQAGPPPATETDINNLTKQVLSGEQARQYEQCSICFEEYVAQDTVLQLPCEHVFHDQCITRWLKLHGTCPVCRKDMTGHDTTI